ncbi:MAG TPA: glycoside hydrolase family 9 protein, partial [Lacipirellulaceae bacterium]|nr:glycoside hydrolase family 9 protein [Lacipirellulaceae bacterium]
RHPYGRPLGDRYHWGFNDTVARQTMNLQVAYRLTGDKRYSETALDAINYLFGRNPFGRSFITGLGHNPPLHPHDRRSGSDEVDLPWPGYLVGGPWPNARDWHDTQDDYRTNEIAINWNGSLIYALAAFVNPRDFDASIAAARNSAKPPAVNASEPDKFDRTRKSTGQGPLRIRAEATKAANER